MRQSRKLDHLKYSLELGDGPVANGFEDISLIHNCMPDISWGEINLTGSLGGIPCNHPVIINAITGGADDVTDINGKLAELASKTNSIMAVGSQYAAMEFPEAKKSFQIVRKKNPTGTILANLGAHVTLEQAKQAVEMIGAQGLQIHLNVAQELVMTEGDRDFSGYFENIMEIASGVNVPVFVKEVGCGIAFEQAKKLMNTGIKVIDTGGVGGTNFLAIEAARSHVDTSSEILRWGIPTAISTMEIVAARKSKPVDIMVSGGIRTPLDAVKALVLGGRAVGLAAPALRLINGNSIDDAVVWLEQFLTEIKRYMLLLGVRSVTELWSAPAIVSGFSREWLLSRGIDVTQYAKRQQHG